LASFFELFIGRHSLDSGEGIFRLAIAAARALLVGDIYDAIRSIETSRFLHAARRRRDVAARGAGAAGGDARESGISRSDRLIRKRIVCARFAKA
jgi:hypothetical protein